MFARFFFMLLAVGIVLAGLGFAKYRSIQAGIAQGAKFAPPPTAVTTVVVKGQTWQPVLSSIGSLKAVNGVVVSTDLAGIVSEIHFESGATVKKGELLVQLDTKEEEAQLRSAEARRDLARLELDRKRDLVAKKAISPSEFDTAESQLRQMEASVQENKALAARKRISAPFQGSLGIRQVNVGQYVNPGAAIVPLQSLDPIYVEFAMPQQHLDSLTNGQPLRITANGVDGTFEGKITAMDARIDEATRNILIQGTIPNPDHKLRPGMFVEIEVLLPEKSGILAIPSSSISYAPSSDSVYVVREEGGKKFVDQQLVKLGPKRGDQVTVLSGLKEGDEVVSSAAFKMRPKAPVTINNNVQPANELKPTPADS